MRFAFLSLTCGLVLAAACAAACHPASEAAGTSANAFESNDAGEVDSGTDGSVPIDGDGGAEGSCIPVEGLTGTVTGGVASGPPRFHNDDPFQIDSISFLTARGAFLQLTFTPPLQNNQGITAALPAGSMRLTASGEKDPDDFFSSELSFTATSGSIVCGLAEKTRYRCTFANVRFAQSDDGGTCAFALPSLVIDSQVDDANAP